MKGTCDEKAHEPAQTFAPLRTGCRGIGKILILAAIVIPLLGVLIFFRGRITELVSEAWENMTGKGDVTDQVNPDIP
ncbi:MAG: hypothetical protein HC898_08420 [Phycisphaerales bacterium]|nr:hypothetical protein [Phycisphaerales bacterium]